MRNQRERQWCQQLRPEREGTERKWAAVGEEFNFRYSELDLYIGHFRLMGLRAVAYMNSRLGRELRT